MNPALVLLAAGVGSRYGSPKQIDPVGPGGATLIDYAAFDARRVGFDRVVLVVRWVVGPTRPWCWLRAKQKDRRHPGRCLRPSEPAQRPRVGFPNEAV